MKARLRRRDQKASTKAPAVLRLGKARVDLAGFTAVDPHGARHKLAPKEVAMLELLWRERGRVVSRARFLREVWGLRPDLSTRTVDTHVLGLRGKLEVDPKAPRVLLTVHGAGYKLAAEGEA